jgi:hypothetical protein
MKIAAGWWSGAALAAAMVALCALCSCNAVLGIGPASLEDGGGTGPATRGPTCAYYCSTILQNCTNVNAEFEGSEDPATLCSAICQAYDSNNQIGPSNDDTLGCRIFYAEEAASDPATFCRIAGPLGGGTCGTDPCQLFCSLDVAYCNSPSINIPAYASTMDCLSACEGDAGYPYVLTGQDLLNSTNTLNCRFWHLENAYGSAMAGAVHCPHTVQASPVCVN